MSLFQINFDWEDPGEAQAAELKATWARLEIRLGEVPITEVLRAQNRTITEYIYLPLYPLAEWIALNWWFLFYEEFTPGRGDFFEYGKRHDIYFGQEGFSLPHLLFRPGKEMMDLEYKSPKLKYRALRFLNEGQINLPTKDVKNTLSNFIEQVVGRLHEYGIEGTLLQEEWEAIISSDADEREYCQFVAALGVNPYGLQDDESSKVVQVFERMPNTIRRDFFASSSIDNLENDLNKSLEILDSISRSEIPLEFLQTIRSYALDAKISTALFPWVQGYQAARLIRDHLGVNGAVVNDQDALAKMFKFPVEELNEVISDDLNIPSAIINAYVANNVAGGPAIALNTQRDNQHSMFSISRSIHDYLFYSCSGPSLVTKTQNDHQKRNRAFAAEFMVPATTLQRELPGKIVFEEEIEYLAHKLDVSSYIIKHQIQNHNLAKIEDPSWL